MTAEETARVAGLESRVAALEVDRKALLHDLAEEVAGLVAVRNAVVELQEDLRGMPAFALRIPRLRNFPPAFLEALRTRDWYVEISTETGEVVLRKEALKPAGRRKKAA